MGGRLADSDYKGELDVILFNFGSENFVVNMGEKRAQLIFGKTKTLAIKETYSLEEIGWGNKGIGSTSIDFGHSENNQDIKTKLSSTKQISVEDSGNAMNQ